MSEFQVTASTADKLTQVVWTFWFQDRDFTLYLDEYEVRRRESTRKKNYNILEYYHRLNVRNHIPGATKLTVEQAPLPSHVIDEVMAQVVAKIKVAKWVKI